MSTKFATLPQTTQRTAWITRQNAVDTRIRYGLFACLLVTVFTTLSIIGILSLESYHFFAEVPMKDFFFNTIWTPLFTPQSFGIWPLVGGTLLVAAIAGIVALPLGVSGAIYLSEYASHKTRTVLKPLIEVLAGIPSIVYGYFALSVVTPALRSVLPDVGVFNALSAGLVMALMILPIILSLSEDALMAVPRSLRSGAYALGATKLETVLRVALPAALSGIGAAFILALSRAIGETMLVTIAAGSTPVLTIDPRQSVQTMTAYIAQISLGETPHGTIEYYTIFAVGMMLFLMTFGMNLISHWIVRKWENRYQ